MDSKVFIRIKDKETGRESHAITIEDLIFKQDEIEFEFGNRKEENYETLPYKDFLFYADDYEVIVHITN